MFSVILAGERRGSLLEHDGSSKGSDWQSGLRRRHRYAVGRRLSTETDAIAHFEKDWSNETIIIPENL